MSKIRHADHPRFNPHRAARKPLQFAHATDTIPGLRVRAIWLGHTACWSDPWPVRTSGPFRSSATPLSVLSLVSRRFISCSVRSVVLVRSMCLPSFVKECGEFFEPTALHFDRKKGKFLDGRRQKLPLRRPVIRERKGLKILAEGLVGARRNIALKSYQAHVTLLYLLHYLTIALYRLLCKIIF